MQDRRRPLRPTSLPQARHSISPPSLHSTTDGMEMDRDISTSTGEDSSDDAEQDAPDEER